MTKMTRTKDIGFELAAKAFSEDGSGEVEGYASVFGNIDHARDVIQQGAFSKTLQLNKGKVKFLWQHDRYQPIGAITELREDEKGLYFKAKFAPTPKGQEARELLKMDGAMGGFSIGFQVVNEIGDEQPDGRIINRITEIRLLEISAVTFPCNEEAVVVGVKSEEAFSEDEAELLEKFKAFLVSQRTAEKQEGVSEGSEGITGALEAVADAATAASDAVEAWIAEDAVQQEPEAEAEALIAIKEALEVALLLDALKGAKLV